MESRRGLGLLALPALAGIGLLIATVALRRSSDVESPRQTRKPSPAPMATAPVSPSPQYTAQNLPKPAPAAVAVKASDEVRLRGTYQNYRTAIATGNDVARGALEKVLLRDRDAAMRMAQDELGRAKTERDREIATLTLEALRR